LINEQDLLVAYREAESDWIERKRNAEDAKRIKQCICAMANDMPGHNRPGVIFVGQNDDLSCSDIDITDELLLKISKWRDDGSIIPIPRMEVRRVVLNGCAVAAVIVSPSENTPVKFDGRIWIRVGPRRAHATPTEEQILVEKRRWGMLPFDAQPCLGAQLEEIDILRFNLEFWPAIVSQEVLNENNRSLEHKLRTARLIDRFSIPTKTGILLLGINPQAWFPGAYVQFRRIDGTNLTDPSTDSRQITGTLPSQLRQLDELLTLNIQRRTIVGASLRDDTYNYPIEALRQIIRNAVIHRNYEGTNTPVRLTWYDDRIEIQSPGGPYGQVTVENFGQGETDYRNPTIAGLLVQLGFVEKFGVGLQIADRALEANGNPPLEHIVNQNHVLITMRPRR
jgi:ATP-dependent DNA helicase RecG